MYNEEGIDNILNDWYSLLRDESCKEPENWGMCRGLRVAAIRLKKVMLPEQEVRFEEIRMLHEEVAAHLRREV